MSRILDRIDKPADLKALSRTELDTLAQEIRKELVTTVFNNGGHLASNLGVVELTLALHRVFDSPRDKIIWDVGHQTYVHKLLTGRRHLFSTLRRYGGISGFPEPSESPHDAFGGGHASTSISAALGMALARDMAGQNYQVVAVIGDGAMTGGMAFEALDQTGHLGTRVIVVLNDNAMSIAPTVGALARAFSRVRFSPRYRRAKEEAEHLMTRLPLGSWLWRWARGLKDGLKRLVLPGMLWEELGFTYMGPVDGHNLADLEEVLARARRYTKRPVLVHVLTHKGKGYSPAERDATAFHGVPPNGEGKGGVPSYSQVFAETVLRLAEEDPRVVAITAAMAEGTGLSLVAKKLPHQVLDVGIREQHAVTLAGGLATQGFIPIVAIYSTFLQRAFDQIIGLCQENLPVIFALDRAGLVGDDGKTHHGAFDLSYLGCIPNLIIAAPSDENELRHLLYTAVKARRPVAIRYPRGRGLGLPAEAELRELPIGKGRVLHEGRDVALLAVGVTVKEALGAAHKLAERGIEASVVDVRFVKPLDADLIVEEARRTRRLVTVEENCLAGGFGSAVLQLLESRGLREIPLECLGLPDEFVMHGTQAQLRARYGLDSEGIIRRVLVAFPDLAGLSRPRP